MDLSDAVWLGSAIMFGLGGTNFFLKGNAFLAILLFSAGFVAISPVMYERHLR